ncbi:uncharacterized protein B0H18DRAFT_849706, partial [Fomitopsis serialis]|uniref:uncharacterized protein n=1 Tax=Fomitopsis serialis TaxID=139415 RepID=UPI002008A033
AWTACATDVWNRDKDMVDKWNREIDTLLVFAGLFSAVVTSFNVQYYPQLQTSTPPKASAI